MTPEERDEGLGEIEAMLRQARLRRPSTALDARVAAALQRWRSVPRLWVVAAAAAMVTVTAGAWAVLEHAGRRASIAGQVARVACPPQPRSTGARALKPVSMVRTYGGISRDGIVGRLADGQPVERIRRKTVRQVLIVDPQRGTHVTISVPHEDVFVVPVRTF